MFRKKSPAKLLGVGQGVRDECDCTETIAGAASVKRWLKASGIRY